MKSEPLPACEPATQAQVFRDMTMEHRWRVAQRFYTSARIWKTNAARELLTEDGVIFISIDDNEVHRLRMLMDEIFGEENFAANIVWQKRTSPDARLHLGPAHDFILVYTKNAAHSGPLLKHVPPSDERTRAYKNPDNDPRGAWASGDLTGQTGQATPEQFYEIATPNGVTTKPPAGRGWALAQRTFLARKFHEVFATAF